MPVSAIIHTASGDACSLIPGGLLKQACVNTGKLVNGNSGGSNGNGSTSTASLLSDPVGSIAHDCAQAAASVIKAVASVVDGVTNVDFTNSGFLTQYAIVFAASAILTVVLWLLAVIKRAVRGEAIVTAIGEATGFLWLAVGASAFTPVILYGMVRVTDSVTSAIGSGTQKDTNNFLASFANTLDPPNGQTANLGGGPILLIFISIVAMLAAAVLWLELLIRAAMLYVGAALAATVYAGLVDKSLWHHVRRWAGMMIAVDLAKPIIVIVLGSATAISGGNTGQGSIGAVLSGLAIMLLSIFASGLIFRFVPSFGDDMLAVGNARAADAPAEAAAGSMDGPAARVRQGIAAHAGRSGTPIGPNPMAAPAMAAMGATAGIAAHGARAAARLTTTRNAGALPPGGGQPPPPAPPPPAAPPPPRDGGQSGRGAGQGTASSRGVADGRGGGSR